MTSATPRFSPEGMAFLRSLKRNNRREWFQPRKAQYDALVREPMLAFVNKLAVDLRSVAPEIVADPKTAVFRIYRDTRFSADKTPYKTNIAASFPWRGLPRHEHAGLYFHVSPSEIWIGGGMYAPTPPQLLAVREHLASHLRRFRSIVESAAFKRVFTHIEGEKLTRVPRGFPADHEAAEWLKYRQILAARELPPSQATSPALYRAVLETFRVAAPLIRFLNEPLRKANREIR